MSEKIDELLGRLKLIEDELLVEVHKKEEEFSYIVHKGKVRFKEGVAKKHKLLAKKLPAYWREARFSSYITTPVILSCIFPILLMDLWAGVYQWICFPAYGIPKVRRKDYVIMDRNHLRYLNFIERLNCVYCGYVNGVTAYVQEVAGRTEQHWCPIKHAVRLKIMHSRYRYFLDYGDAEQYRERIEKVRRAFEDLKKGEGENGFAPIGQKMAEGERSIGLERFTLRSRRRGP